MSAPKVFWEGTFPSNTGRRRKRDGAPMAYAVTLYADGTYACVCGDYLIRSKGAGDPMRRCKHIAQAVAQAPGWTERVLGVPEAPAAATEPSPPTVGIVGIDIDELEPTAYRRR